MKKLAFVLLTLISFNVYANCPGQFDPRSGICSFQGHDGRLIQYNSSAPQSGNTATHRIIQYVDVHVPSKYGAIAISKKTGNVGGSVDASSKAEAKERAIKRCESGGHAPCEIVTWVRNGCVAATQGKQGKTWTLFTAAEERGQAESVAMKRCTDSGAAGCRLLLPEGCSLPDGE